MKTFVESVSEGEQGQKLAEQYIKKHPEWKSGKGYLAYWFNLNADYAPVEIEKSTSDLKKKIVKFIKNLLKLLLN